MSFVMLMFFTIPAFAADVEEHPLQTLPLLLLELEL